MNGEYQWAKVGDDDIGTIVQIADNVSIYLTFEISTSVTSAFFICICSSL
jgi:hypothetical protein